MHSCRKKYERGRCDKYRCRQENLRTAFSISFSAVHTIFWSSLFLPQWHSSLPTRHRTPSPYPSTQTIRSLTRGKITMLRNQNNSLKHASLSWSWYFFCWSEDENVFIHYTHYKLHTFKVQIGLALRARPILKLLARLLPELYSTPSNYYYYR